MTKRSTAKVLLTAYDSDGVFLIFSEFLKIIKGSILHHTDRRINLVYYMSRSFQYIGGYKNVYIAPTLCFMLLGLSSNPQGDD